MIQNQYQPTYISSATTTVVQAAGLLTLHTVVVPVASTGAITFQDSSGTAYFVLPVGTVGSFRFDATLNKGLSIVTAAADKLVATTQTP